MRSPSAGASLGAAPLVAMLVLIAASCGGGSSASIPTSPTGPLTTGPPPADVALSVAAVDLGGRDVLATAELRGAAAVQFEWYFERAALPEVVTTANQARYTYPSTGFKDFTVRVTLADGRRALGSGAVVVE